MSRKEEIFKTNLQKLSKLSRDDTNNVIMICSEIKAVNYDNVINIQNIKRYIN